jgi:hypothetical protein
MRCRLRVFFYCSRESCKFLSLNTPFQCLVSQGREEPVQGSSLRPLRDVLRP